jgi:DNA-directed RNA polymerase subunit D
MKITKLSNKNKLILKIEGTSAIYLNTIRRLIMSEVPTMAIDEIEVRKNDSVLYDEMLALRLGLVVLSTDLKTYSEREEGEAESAKNTLQLTLKVKGPGTVYAKQLKSKDPAVKPIHPNTIIADLLENQEIQLIAKARLGSGKEHAKWSPGIAYYKDMTYVTIKKDSAEVKKIIKPFVEEKKKKIKVLDYTNVDTEFNPKIMKQVKDKVEFKPNKEDFIFYVEPWGQLDPKTILEQAIAKLNSKADDFKKILK